MEPHNVATSVKAVYQLLADHVTAYSSIYTPVFAVVALYAFVVMLAMLWLVVTVFEAPPASGSPATLPNGMKIMQWTKTETDFLYSEIFGSESEYGRSDAVKLHPGATVVDAGANIGMFTLWAASKCKGDATILSFEPIPSTHSVLQANAESAMRGAYSSVFQPSPAARLVIHTPRVGLSEEAGQVTFAHHPHLSIWSTADEGLATDRLKRIEEDIGRAVSASPTALVRWLIPSWLARTLAHILLQHKIGKTVQVQAKLRTLSSFIEQYNLQRIDLLKVDVEGAEMSVLKGVTPAHWQRVQQVVAEVENFAAARDMCSFLEARGFVAVSRATERERTPGVTSEVSMVYASRPSKAEGSKAGAGASPAMASAKQRRGSVSSKSSRR